MKGHTVYEQLGVRTEYRKLMLELAASKRQRQSTMYFDVIDLSLPPFVDSSHFVKHMHESVPNVIDKVVSPIPVFHLSGLLRCYYSSSCCFFGLLLNLTITSDVSDRARDHHRDDLTLS